MTTRRLALAFRTSLFLLLASPAAFTQAASPQAGTPQAVSSADLPVDVLVQGPSETSTELQVICLFRSVPSNTLHASLAEMDQKLKGVLGTLRKPSLFSGELGETLLIAPPPGTIAAHRLLIIGLGDASTFTPARMDLVGTIVYNEADRLHIRHPFFAPTVLDGGVSGFATGEVAEQFIHGFLRARRTALALKAAGQSPGETVEALTFLAGAAHAADTQAGITKGRTTP